MNRYQSTSMIDRLAPVVVSLIVVALVLAGLLHGAHRLSAAVDSLSMMIGGLL